MRMRRKRERRRLRRERRQRRVSQARVHCSTLRQQMGCKAAEMLLQPRMEQGKCNLTSRFKYDYFFDVIILDVHNPLTFMFCA
jgi:hypothetical protein